LSDLDWGWALADECLAKNWQVAAHILLSDTSADCLEISQVGWGGGWIIAVQVCKAEDVNGAALSCVGADWGLARSKHSWDSHGTSEESRDSEE